MNLILLDYKYSAEELLQRYVLKVAQLEDRERSLRSHLDEKDRVIAELDKRLSKAEAIGDVAGDIKP
jgi:soluble P-type ATPase